ncbi:MAG: hypothetical protein DME22_03125 [Verrucomicrobia bacterium]|nr:MAG: hypothetical protein DME22_03125 [Verrucomicrobiota bacterium]PYK02093.1 MAG: hypothetical protein DME23_02600 [Verrucomicrobiota bacterium]
MIFRRGPDLSKNNVAQEMLLTKRQQTFMRRYIVFLAISVGLSLAINGCSKNGPAGNVAELEKAFQTKASDVAKPDAANASGTTQGQGDQIQQTVGRAVSALKTNGYLEAFVALRSVQAAPNLTLEQYTAVVNARLAVEKEVAARAVAGDPVAMRAVEAIQNSSRR